MPKQSLGSRQRVASHPPSPPLPCPAPADTKVTWRAAISGHKAAFSSDSDFLDPVTPKRCWAPGNRGDHHVYPKLCAQQMSSGVSATGQEVTAALGPGSRWEVRQAPEASPLLFLLAAFPAGSLASLIYGEQSEKTSPSDIPLEMEHKDKVSAR